MAVRPSLCYSQHQPLKHDCDDQCSGSQMTITKGADQLRCHCDQDTNYLVAPRANVLGLNEDWVWFYPKPCVHNVMSALVGRVGKHIPRFQEDAVHLLRGVTLRLAGHCKAETVDCATVYSRYSGSKRARYESAHARLIQRDYGVSKKDAHVNMFVKMEAYRMNKKFPDCRAIQFRSFEYTLMLASMTMGPEHRLYGLKDLPDFQEGKLFAKNLNQYEKAEALREHWDRDYDHCICLDASRFDAHCNPGILSCEHAFWTRANPDSYLRKLLSMQINNKGRVQLKDGQIHYQVKGGRMSGDRNTAGGNCIIMYCMLWCFFNQRNHRFAILDDGDDSVVFYDGDEVTDEEVSAYFKRFGFVMSVEARPKCFEHIEFCQSRPVQIDGAWVMIRNPMKIISKLGYTHKRDNVRTYRKRLLTTATCEAWLAQGVPMLQPFCQRVLEIVEPTLTKRQMRRGKYLGVEHLSYRMQHLITKIEDFRGRPISSESRASFRRAFGFSETYQREFEASLRFWTPSIHFCTAGAINDKWYLEGPYPEWS